MKGRMLAVNCARVDGLSRVQSFDSPTDVFFLLLVRVAVSISRPEADDWMVRGLDLFFS